MNDTRTCPQCGAAMGTGVAACSACGTAIPAAAEISPAFPVLPPPPAMQAAQAATMLPYGELQQAAIYCAMARTLRGIGIGNIIWGVAVIVIGAEVTDPVTIGIRLVGVSRIYSLLRRTVVHVVFDAIVVRVGGKGYRWREQR